MECYRKLLSIKKQTKVNENIEPKKIHITGKSITVYKVDSLN